jgi:hypothetical protein
MTVRRLMSALQTVIRCRRAWLTCAYCHRIISAGKRLQLLAVNRIHVNKFIVRQRMFSAPAAFDEVTMTSQFMSYRRQRSFYAYRSLLE